MDVVIWTIVFLGGSALAVVLLLLWAVKKDREKLVRAENGDTGDPGD
ncbi:hypothetical protein [Phytoactinopolyspora halophila]|nr:hypothetical protein [Phytoactinopolyspora halophila]